MNVTQVLKRITRPCLGKRILMYSPALLLGAKSPQKPGRIEGRNVLPRTLGVEIFVIVRWQNEECILALYSLGLRKVLPVRLGGGVDRQEEGER